MEAMSKICELPDELIQYIFSFADLKSLTNFELVCKLWHNLLNDETSSYIWKGLIFSICKNRVFIKDNIRLSALEWKKLSRLITESLMKKEQNVQDSTTHEEQTIHEERDEFFDEEMEDVEESTSYIPKDFFKNTVVLRAVSASSVDFSSQSIDETRSLNKNRFWSSKGSKEETASESAIYLLREPDFKETKDDIGVILVTKFSFMPFKADWQEGRIYAPKKVSVSFGLSKENFDIYTTPEYDVQNLDIIQTFDIGPIALIYKGSFHQQVTSNEEIDRILRDIKVTQEDLMEVLPQSIENNEINEAILMRLLSERLESKREIARQSLIKGTWYVRVNFLGKYQRQPGDELYYTCVNVLDLHGDTILLRKQK